MAAQQNIDKAVGLVDRMCNLTDQDRKILKKRIIGTARGDNSALGYMISSPYDHRDCDIVGEILSLVLRD